MREYREVLKKGITQIMSANEPKQETAVKSVPAKAPAKAPAQSAPLPGEPFLTYVTRLRLTMATEALGVAISVAKETQAQANTAYRAWQDLQAQSTKANAEAQAKQAAVDAEPLLDALRKADADARMGGLGQGRNQGNFSQAQERDYLSENWNQSLARHATAAAIAQDIHGGSMAVSVGQYNAGRGLALPVSVWARLAADGRKAELSPDTMGRALGQKGWTHDQTVYAADWVEFYRQWFA